MADIATLGIKVENGDVVKATTSLEGMTVASAKTEAATQRLTRRMALAELEARQMNATFDRNQTAIGRFQTQLERLGMSVPGLTTAFGALSAIGALGFLGHETIQNTMEAQDAMAQLEAAVASTGGAAGRTVQQLDDLSVALQHTTTYSDEAVKGAESILLTFNKIRGTQFDEATKAVTNLAARMGGDLQGAALQVGKALQDPNTGLTALRRSGVSFTEEQQRVIKALFDTGHEAEAQRRILAELEHQYGGSAEAARNTFAGALKALKNAFGDLFEVSRTGSQGTVDALNAITHWLEHSGLSMNKIIHDAAVDWETMRASVEKAHAIMSLPIGKGFMDAARAISDAIDKDLATNIARMNQTAAPGETDEEKTKRLAALQRAADETERQQDALDKQHLRNLDLVRDAEQAADLAGLQGDTADRVRILYEAQNKILEAQRTLKGDILQETIDAIREEERIKLGGADRAEQMKLQHDAIQNAKQELDSMEEDFTSKLSKSLSRVFGPNNPLRGMFESLTKDLLGVWISRFVEPAAAAFLGIDMARLGKPGVLTGESGHGGIADASVSMAPGHGFGIGMAGLAGFGTGYSTGNSAFGALGGVGTALSLGAGPVGIAVGALAGLTGGLLGAGKAAREAARQLEVVRQAFTNAMKSFEAAANGDSLQQQVEQIKAQADALRQQADAQASAGAKYLTKVFGQAWTNSAFGDGPNNVAGNIAHITQVEQDYIAKLEREAAIKAQQAQEDLDVRTLRNKGLTHEADVQAKLNADAREYAAAVDAKMSQAYLDQLKLNQGMEEAAVAAGKASDAMHSLADGLNQVAGYNLARAVFGNASPFAVQNTVTTTSAYTPPAGPTDRGGMGTPSQPVVVNLVVDGKKMTSVVVDTLKMRAAQQFGDTTRWGETS